MRLLQNSMSDLMLATDSDCVASVSGVEHQAAFIFAGSGGGTGGGGVDLCTTALHDAARRIGLPNLEVNRCTEGPVMQTSDPTRKIDSDRKDRILANAADNSQALYSQMNTRNSFEEETPEGNRFSVNSSTRIHSNIEFENRSDNSRIHRCEEMNWMIAETAFFRLLSLIHI